MMLMRKVKLLLGILLMLSVLFTCPGCEESDWGFECYNACDCEVSKEIGDVLFVGPNQVFNSFSVHSVTGDLTADGSCHADFFVEYRWADDERAKNDIVEPPLDVLFVTTLGYFPQAEYEQKSYVNKEGMHCWALYESQAADKNNHSPDSYGVRISYLGDTGGDSLYNKVRCLVKINYKTYQEDLP
jgi:hypothetical protein